MDKITYTFSKKLEKHLWMNSFLELVTFVKLTFSEVFFKDFV